AMNKAAENVYKHLLEVGNQEALLDSMQTRKELYAHLNYHDYEDKLDQLFSQES
ncbi:methylisocitrate lyase, partial [Vibrio sp. DNB22_19_1]